MEKIIIILKLLPVIISAIKAIEESVTGTGFGVQKLQAVRQILELADNSIGTIWPTVESTIKVLVNLFNTTGVFKK